MKKLLLIIIAVLALGYEPYVKSSATVDVKTKQEFQSYLQTHPVVVVMFGSSSCPHCRKMLPIFNQIAGSTSGVSFAFVEAFSKELSDLLYQYQVKGVPTFKVYKSGKVVDSLTGEKTKEQLVQFIQKNK